MPLPTLEGGATVPSKWILITEGKQPAQWYLWTEGVDGPWPEHAATSVESGAPSASTSTDSASALVVGSTWIGTEKATNSENPLSIVMWVKSVDDDTITCLAWYPDYNQGVKEIVLSAGADGGLSVSRSDVLYGKPSKNAPGLLPALMGAIKVDGRALTGSYAFMDGSKGETAMWSLTKAGD
jgi:hypothetical protein